MREFRDIVTNPYDDLRSRCGDRPAVGYLCTYAPEEIIHAAGAVPIRVTPGTGPDTPADAHLPSHVCGVARGSLTRLLGDGLDSLQGVVFSHTCDTMQCLADVLALARPDIWVDVVGHPTVLDSSGGREYLVAELQRFAGRISQRVGAVISIYELTRSVEIYNHNRNLLGRLRAFREMLSASEYLNVLNAGLLMPKEEHNALLDRLLGELWKGRTQPERSEGPRLLISGSFLTDTTVLELIEELGGVIVGDDLCNGTRYVDTLVAKSDDPIAALADRYLRRAPCPCKQSPQRSRSEWILDGVQRSRADAVLFVLEKFCEPHAFDYPHLAEVLEGEGISTMRIEVERVTVLGQLRTRLQAFLERLSTGRGNGT